MATRTAPMMGSAIGRIVLIALMASLATVVKAVDRAVTTAEVVVFALSSSHSLRIAYRTIRAKNLTAARIRYVTDTIKIPAAKPIMKHSGKSVPIRFRIEAIS